MISKSNVEHYNWGEHCSFSSISIDSDSKLEYT